MTNTVELKIALLKAGVSQKQLAETLKINKNTVYRKINNLNEFKVKEIKLISELLSLTTEQEKRIFFGNYVD